MARGFHHVGAWIIGRNMFGPIRGPWPDESWKGWWGENPPYHTPVFVLRLIEYLHLAISPVLLGSGEQLFANIDMLKLGYRSTEHLSTPKATHVVLTKSS